MRRLLIVAATTSELCGHDGLVCGIGPVEAAATTARALALEPPEALLHVGLAGAHGLQPGELAIGTESAYRDLDAAIPVHSTLTPDLALLACARRALPAAVAVAIETSAVVSGPGGPASRPRVEAMEGFGVLRAAQLAGVPALEVRVVSNELGEPDRSLWRIEAALEALARALPVLIAGITAP